MVVIPFPRGSFWSRDQTQVSYIAGRFFTDWATREALYIRVCVCVCVVKVAQSCLTLCNPLDYTFYGILPARILEWVTFPFSRGSSQPRDWTQVSGIAGRFFTSWATREAKNTGMDSLSLLQQIFLTQESNRGLLHCRQILYQLSYQGSAYTHTHKHTHTHTHI